MKGFFSLKQGHLLTGPRSQNLENSIHRLKIYLAMRDHEYMPQATGYLGTYKGASKIVV